MKTGKERGALIVCALALGAATGWFLPAAVEHFNKNDRDVVGFVDSQAEDVAWACRLSHGLPSYGLYKGSVTSFGTVTCTPGAGAPTSEEAIREAMRQERLADQRAAALRAERRLGR